MVRGGAAIAALVCCAAWMSVWAGAVTFIDDMESIGPGIRQSANLNSVRRSGLVPRDQTQLVVPAENDHGSGTVRYRVSGLESVQLRIYTPLGTFASVGADGMGEAILFGFGNDRPNFAPEQVLDTYYSFAQRRIYTFGQGGWHLLSGQGQALPPFSPTPQGPPDGSIVRMGVNVLASSSPDRPETPVILTRTAIQPIRLEDGSLVVAEDFASAGVIPAGARYLWVELNDPGGTLLTQSGVRTSLAWVSMSGRSLQMGPPPPAQTPPPVTEYEPDLAQPPDTPATPRLARPAAPQAPASRASAAPQEATTRFEGVITAPETGQGSGGSRPPVSRSTDPPQAQQVPGREAPPGPDELAVYEISREAAPKGSLPGVGIYIALLVGAVGYLLLRPKLRTKAK